MSVARRAVPCRPACLWRQRRATRRGGRGSVRPGGLAACGPLRAQRSTRSLFESRRRGVGRVHARGRARSSMHTFPVACIRHPLRDMNSRQRPGPRSEAARVCDAAATDCTGPRKRDWHRNSGGITTSACLLVLASQGMPVWARRCGEVARDVGLDAAESAIEVQIDPIAASDPSPTPRRQHENASSFSFLSWSPLLARYARQASTGISRISD